jgi:hypothetical protein
LIDISVLATVLVLMPGQRQGREVESRVVLVVSPVCYSGNAREGCWGSVTLVDFIEQTPELRGGAKKN